VTDSAADAASEPAARRGDRRELAVAAALCVVGGAVALIAAGRPWVTETLHRPPLPDRIVRHTGADLSGAPGALGWVAVAGALALVAARGRARSAVGALLVAVGVGIVVAVAVTARGTALPGTASGWPWVAGVGGALVIAGAALTVARGRRWAAMSARYDAPAERTARAVDPHVAQWDALDRGDDPTR
jgi:uncharacterized membrane protein (TIGR02234 family)